MNRTDFVSGAITGFTLGVIIMALIFMSVGCASSGAPDPSAKVPEVIETDDSRYELIGCIDRVCTYAFHYRTNRCFLSVGSYAGFGNSWMFDLECP